MINRKEAPRLGWKVQGISISMPLQVFLATFSKRQSTVVVAYPRESTLQVKNQQRLLVTKKKWA